MRIPPLLAVLLLAPALAAADPPEGGTPGVRFRRPETPAASGPALGAGAVLAELKAMAADCSLDYAEFESRFAGRSLAPDGGRLYAAAYDSFGILKTRTDGGDRLTREVLEKQVVPYVAGIKPGDRSTPIGEATARIGLRIAVTAFLPRLAPDGLDYVAGIAVPGVDLVPAENETVAAEVSPKARVLDCNLSGGLDGEDVVLLPKASGTMSVRPLGAELAAKAARSARLQRAVLESAQEFIAKKDQFGFVGPADIEFNPAFWTRESATSDNPCKAGEKITIVRWRMRPDVKPAAAVRDVLGAPGGTYKFECAVAVKLVYHIALLKSLGDQRYNAAFAGAAVGAAEYEPELLRVLTQSPPKADQCQKPSYADSSFLGGVRPGDGLYVWAPGVCRAVKAMGWGGENMIYIGGGKSMAFPLGLADVETVKARIRDVVQEQDCNYVEPVLVNELFRPDPERAEALGK